MLCSLICTYIYIYNLHTKAAYYSWSWPAHQGFQLGSYVQDRFSPAQEYQRVHQIQLHP
jgi:hypothetical protein